MKVMLRWMGYGLWYGLLYCLSQAGGSFLRVFFVLLWLVSFFLSFVWIWGGIPGELQKIQAEKKKERAYCEEKKQEAGGDQILAVAIDCKVSQPVVLVSRGEGDQ